MPQRSSLLVLSVAILFGCGGTAGNPGSPAPDSGEPDAGQPDAGQPDAGAPDAGPDAGPVGTNHAPTAAFTANATAQQLTGVTFDASASTDPDGDPLTYSWDFGDGERGGNTSLAHSFSQPGAFTVKLTVADGRGGVNTVQHAITISAATHGASVTLSGLVEDVNGPLGGVLVQDVGGSSSSTDGAGHVSLSISAGIPHTIKLSKTGYGDQFQPVNLDAAATSGVFRTAMLAAEPAQPLDSAAGGSLAGKDGASITLPAGALTDTSGNAVTGTVQISQTPLDISGSMIAAFPGKFAGVTPGGAQSPIATHGTTQYQLTKNGVRLQLAPGKTAGIQLPLYATQNLDGSSITAGDKLPLWSLSEKTGLWVQEGEGTVVASSAAPSGFALQAQVSHFSWWNADVLLGPPYKPKPKCFLNPGPEFTPIPIPCSIGPRLPGEFQTNPFRRLAAGGGFVRPPNYNVRADIPINGGVALPVPADVDFGLNACTVSDNLFYCGSVTVHGAANASDDVRILLSPTPPAGTCGAPTTIVPPLSQNFSVAAAGQASCLQFTAQAGQILTLTVAQAPGSQLTGGMQLTGPAAQVLGSAAYSFNHTAVITTVTPTTGTYGLKVGVDAGAPGAFSLGITLETPQTIPVPTSGVFQVPSNGVRHVNFDAAAGDVIAVSVKPSGPNGGGPGTVKSLQDGSSSAYTNFVYGAVTIHASVAGTYGIEVTSSQSDGPNFFLSVSKAQPISLGAPVAGALGTGGAVQSYAVDLTAGDLVAAAARGDCIQGSQSPPEVRMFDPAGQELDPFATRNGGSTGPFATNPTAIAVSGTYRLDAFLNSTLGCPAFSIGAVHVDPPAAVTATAPATSASGTIAGPGNQSYYSVNLNAGDVVRLAIHTDSVLGATAELLDSSAPFNQRRAALVTIATEGPQPDTIGTDAVDEATDPFVIPASGEYFVHVSHVGTRLSNAAGAFSWSLFAPATQALSLDTLRSVASGTQFFFDRYDVTVPSAGVRLFSARQTTTGTNVSVSSNLRDSTGSVVQPGNGFRVAESIYLLPAGTYTYEVYGRVSLCTPKCTLNPFAYDLISPSIEAPVPIAVGDTKSGAIDVIAERDYYQFTATAGQPVTVGSTGAGGLVGQARLFKLPANGDFTDDSSFTQASAPIGTPFNFTIPTAGTWVIEIDGTGTNNTSTGTYTVSLH